MEIRIILVQSTSSSLFRCLFFIFTETLTLSSSPNLFFCTRDYPSQQKPRYGEFPPSAAALWFLAPNSGGRQKVQEAPFLITDVWEFESRKIDLAPDNAGKVILRFETFFSESKIPCQEKNPPAQSDCSFIFLKLLENAPTSTFAFSELFGQVVH